MNPPNHGWIEIELDDRLKKHLWDCVEAAGDKKNAKPELVGQIDKSYAIEDLNNFFWKHLLSRCVDTYRQHYGCDPVKAPVKKDLVPYLDEMWVNYQNKHEYNPIHNHGGVYSFVVWLTIPTEYQDQAKLSNASDSISNWNSCFAMHYTDSLGRLRCVKYEMGEQWRGKMLFFPASMNHEVFPYYECDDQRISISGNIWMKESTNTNDIS